MGPARRHLDCLAAQSGGLAEQVSADPLGVLRNFALAFAAEDVHILVNDLPAEKRATSMLRRQGANLARLHFHHWRTDRVWLRDSGPIFVKKRVGESASQQISEKQIPFGGDSQKSEDLAITNWRFNAWAKYDNWHNDDLIPRHVAELYAMPSFEPTVTLADGANEFNSAWCSKAAPSTRMARACC